MSHIFTGKWITTKEFSRLNPRNVFHKQLDKVDLPCTEHRNRHILFRRHFCLNALPKRPPCWSLRTSRWYVPLCGAIGCSLFLADVDLQKLFAGM